MTLLLALLLTIPFPATSKVTWMRPESFRLTVGMSRADSLREIESSGWKVRGESTGDQVVVEYAEDKSITLDFQKDRLTAIRFELYAILPEAHQAFAQEKALLKSLYGEPKKLRSRSVIVYDNILPNVMVVLSADPTSEHGKRGIGHLVVRYYDPVAK